MRINANLLRRCVLESGQGEPVRDQHPEPGSIAHKPGFVKLASDVKGLDNLSLKLVWITTPSSSCWPFDLCDIHRFPRIKNLAILDGRNSRFKVCLPNAYRCTCAASSQDRSAGVRGLLLWDRTVQAQPQGACEALPPRSQQGSDRVASGAFWRHTQDQRSLLAQEFPTKPLQSLL
jgi:hypothetical protein